MQMVSTFGLYELTYDEMLAIDGGCISLRTLSGIGGAIFGGIAGAVAGSPSIVGAVTGAVIGAGAGYLTGVGLYDEFTN